MEKVTLKMKLEDETYKAILVRGEHPVRNRYLWIPRSLIEYMKKSPREEDGSRFVEFTLPEWKVEQDNLWRYEL